MNNSTVATIQIDWSENAKMTQAREEKKAYYEDCQVSVHAMHQWTSEGNQSVASLSDHTRHQVAAVMVSVKPVLESLVKNGKVKINIVSDLPTSQYRNKKIFYMIQQFANEYEVTVHWIYLEAGHGKGIPDSVGAVVKCAIKDIIMYNPDDPRDTVDQLIQSGLQDHLPSVKIVVYSEEDVNSLESKLPDIQQVVGTAKIHDVLVEPFKKTLTVKDFSNKKSYDVQVTYTEQKSTTLTDPDESGIEDEELNGESENENSESSDAEGSILFTM